MKTRSFQEIYDFCKMDATFRVYHSLPRWANEYPSRKKYDYYWREFASKLPKEEKANASRMMNIPPKLLNDTTFEIGVDNEMVGKYMNQLLPRIQAYLREKLHNQLITMTIRVLEEKEVIRAYSPLERFHLMSQRNPKLLKLKETFNLDLS